ncbi:MAG: hypothetical protein UX26_C0026G0005 [Parcubacteria group bacterium GW2011_GWC1_45_9]|nr:MAG: hypothetical protein UW85_C0003G0045 [Parcubacteria group bacterium GW2011_GWA1_Parcubacteria_45_10]KKT87811.1 MAG: hypothetical protein UW89_C0017G0003 [Parcubacteria group bacterium GW2011_GWB1_45_10]KKU16352.1 MAG: hypothetical protein UX26_C0026G0005 [Parcubacteria group bacterium GW2011_GWC1_45_9]HCI05130.1 hypothetical protein [Patescibacteria group bacterium]
MSTIDFVVEFEPGLKREAQKALQKIKQTKKFPGKELLEKYGVSIFKCGRQLGGNDAWLYFKMKERLVTAVVKAVNSQFKVKAQLPHQLGADGQVAAVEFMDEALKNWLRLKTPEKPPR